MSPTELITEIVDKILVIFGAEGFGGTAEEYRWLLANYGITEEEDVRWQFVLEQDCGITDAKEDLDEADEDDAKLAAFLEDPDAIWTFLETLLTKYRSSSNCYR